MNGRPVRRMPEFLAVSWIVGPLVSRGGVMSLWVTIMPTTGRRTLIRYPFHFSRS